MESAGPPSGKPPETGSTAAAAAATPAAATPARGAAGPGAPGTIQYLINRLNHQPAGSSTPAAPGAAQQPAPVPEPAAQAAPVAEEHAAPAPGAAQPAPASAAQPAPAPVAEQPEQAAPAGPPAEPWHLDPARRQRLQLRYFAFLCSRLFGPDVVPGGDAAALRSQPPDAIVARLRWTLGDGVLGDLQARGGRGACLLMPCC